MEELTKAYDPKQTEDRIYELWEKSGAFKPADDTKVDKNPQDGISLDEPETDHNAPVNDPDAATRQLPPVEQNPVPKRSLPRRVAGAIVNGVKGAFKKAWGGLKAIGRAVKNTKFSWI